MNQLQKDIKIALSWKSWLPYGKTYKQDMEAFNRLECFIKKDISIYYKLEMQKIIKEAIKNEKTDMGKSVLNQLLEKVL